MLRNVLALLFCFCFCPPALAQTFFVEKVLDGDTILLTNGKEIRLIGIDVPESQPNEKARRLAKETGKNMQSILAVGKKAGTFIKPLLEGKEVRLEFDKETIDAQERFWAYVYDVGTYKDKKNVWTPSGYEMSGNEIFINATIVKSGYASPLMLPPNIKHARLFKKLFQEAQQKKRGLWK